MKPVRDVLSGPAAVAVLAFGLFARTLNYQLLWDDPALLDNIRLRVHQDGMWGLLTSEFILDPSRSTGFYRPVVLFSLWIDSRLAAFLPQIYHLTNVALHALASVLVFWLVRRLTDSHRAALLGSVLFAVHPVHCESVSFVSGRTDLWAALFVLISALAWLKDQAGDGRHRLLLRATGLGAFLLAMLSKEVALMLPAVLLLGNVLVARGGDERSPGWLKRNGFWLAGWFFCLVLVGTLRWGVLGSPLGPHELVGSTPMGIAVVRMALALIMHLRLLVIPWPLNAYYTFEEIHVSPLSVAGVLVLAGACTLLAGKRHGRVGLLGLVWIGGFLLPVTAIVTLRGAPVAERFLYLPSVGFALVAGYGLHRMASAPRLALAARAVALSATILFAAATFSRQAVWQSPLALFSDLVQTSPAYANGHYNLGEVLMQNGRYREAVVVFQRALMLAPEKPRFHNNLGTALAVLGEYEQAKRAFEKAAEIAPDLDVAYVNLANVYVALGDTEQVIAMYRKAIGLQTRNFEAYFNLSEVYLKIGRPGEAFNTLKTMTERFAESPQLRSQGEELLARHGREDLAARLRSLP